MDPGIAHIIYASDANFAEMLGISLTSVLENSRDMEDIRVHILDMGIEIADKEKIESVCRFYNRSAPHWIPVEDITGVLDMDVEADRGSTAQFARIFISRHIDESIDRVLYMDCDIVARKSIRELWNLDLKGKTIAALLDAFSRAYRHNIGLEPDDIMFNSGVMLIDMRRWRLLNIEDQVLAFIRSRRGAVEKGDQGALTAVLSRDCLCFDPKFNSVTIFYDFTYREMLSYRKPPDFYPEKVIKRAKEDPTLIHYTLSFLSKRPWMVGSRHPWKDEWLKYKAMSPWHDAPLREEHRGRSVYMLRKMPRPLMLGVTGLMQAYGRPWAYRIRHAGK